MCVPLKYSFGAIGKEGRAWARKQRNFERENQYYRSATVPAASLMTSFMSASHSRVEKHCDTTTP